MPVDLMGLADVANPELIAKEIIKQCPELLLPIDVNAICYSCGIESLNAIETAGFEGALITNNTKTNGAILFNAQASITRQRFTISHELGHFLIPSHYLAEGQSSFYCTPNDLKTFHSNSPHQNKELEANAFAAELLMPEVHFKADVRRIRYLDLDEIISLRTKYNVSLEVLVRRYGKFTNESCAFIFWNNDKSLHSISFGGFPELYLRKNSPIAIDIKKISQGKPSEWTEADSDEWFLNTGKKVCIQSYRQNEDYGVTLLTFPDEDEEEIESVRWKEPSFSKR